MGVVAADGGELVRCWRKGWQWDRRRGRKKRKKIKKIKGMGTGQRLQQKRIREKTNSEPKPQEGGGCEGAEKKKMRGDCLGI